MWRLSRDEPVTSHQPAQSIKPDRVVYEITEAGLAELARPVVPEPSDGSTGEPAAS